MFAQAFSQTGDLIQLKNSISVYQTVTWSGPFPGPVHHAVLVHHAGTLFGTDKGWQQAAESEKAKSSFQ